jgi:membrane protease YdiL (CAAX protease family)
LVAEARQQIRRTRNYSIPLELIIEILIFIAVFMASAFVFEGAIASIGMIPLIFTSETFIETMETAVASGQYDLSMENIMEISEALMSSPAMVILTLFATLGAIIAVFLYCRLIEKRRLSTLGFTRGHAVREYLVGALIGCLLFSLAILICLLTNTLTFEGLTLGSLGILVLFFFGFLIQGLSEEVMCRGYFMVSLARKQSLAVAVLVSSSAFGALHLFNTAVQPLAILNIILFGCLAGVYMLKRGNIWGVAAMHSLWNFVQGNIYGIHVSGMEEMPSLLSFSPTEAGTLINGGAFGLEGGLAVTIVLVVALLIALLMKASNPAPQVMPIDGAQAQVVIMPGSQPLPHTTQK